MLEHDRLTDAEIELAHKGKKYREVMNMILQNYCMSGIN